MNVRQRQLFYGGIWGGGAFLTGLLLTYILVPEGFGLERWRASAWFFLSANRVPIAGVQLSGVSGIGQTADLIATTGRLEALYALPPVLITFAGVLTADSVGYTTRSWYIFQNTLAGSFGYVFVGLAIIVFSGARPTVGLIVILGGLFGGALLVGSQVANSLGQIPILGVTTIGGLTLIGLAIILGGFTVVAVLAPMIGLGAFAAAAAAMLLKAIRRRR